MRSDGTFSCPACGTGTMHEHDEGYDECDSCSFFAIYETPRSGAMSPGEIDAAYRHCFEEWKELSEPAGLAPGAGGDTP